MSERHKNPLIFYGVGAIAVYKLVTGAFSRDTWFEIMNRDGFTCTVCGASDHVEAAHYNHNRTYPGYDDPDNGRALCPPCHLDDHINRSRNGLNKRENNWAIEQLSERVGAISPRQLKLQLD